ncbi:MAG TPA: Ig-like domain-containing protein, partial [Sphingobacteriaceae bacterium]
MRPLKFIALLVCLVPSIAYSQIVDPSFNSPLPFTRPGINIVKVMPDGKIMLGGAFDMYGSQVRQSLIRLNADGSLDDSFIYPLGKDRNTIYSIEPKSNGDIVVHDAARAHTLAANGAIVNTFESADFMEYIRTIKVLPDGKTLVAGFGISSGSFLRRHNNDGTIDHSFSFPLQVGVSDILFKDDRIIISDAWGMIMAVYANGEPDYSFEPGPFKSYGDFYTLNGIEVQPDGKIIRFFNTPMFPTYNRVHMVRHDGSAESEEVISPVQHTVVGMRFWNNKIYVQEVIRLLALPRQETRITRLNPDGTLDATFTPITALHQFDSKGFDVEEDGSVIVVNSDLYNRSGINRYDVNGNLVAEFNPDLRRYGYYKVIRKQADNKLVVAGNFYSVGDHLTKNVARLLPDGTPDRTFAVTVDHGEGMTAELAANGGVVVSASDDIFKLDATGALDEDFEIERTDDLTQITKMQVLPDGKIVMLGYNNIYRIQADGKLDPTFACGTCAGGDNGGAPDFIVQQDGKIIYASISNEWNGEPVPTIIRINTDGTLDRSFAIGTGPDANAFLTQVLPAEGGFVLRGYMESFNGRPVMNALVKVNNDGTFDETFMANYETLQPREIYHFRPDVSGYFRTTVDFQGDSYLFNVDRLAPDGTIDNSFQLPSNFKASFVEDIAADNNAVWMVGENTLDGQAVFMSKFLRSSISITGTTLGAVAEDTSFELLPGHIIIEGLGDIQVADLQLQISPNDNYSVSGNTITPALNFNGVITVPVIVLNNSQALVSGEISIMITPVNDKPVITAVNVQILEDVLTEIALDRISFTDVDSDSTAISVQVQAGENFTVSGNSIVGAENYNGPVQITLTLYDGVMVSDPFTFTAEISPVNDPPTIMSATKNQKCSQSSPLTLLSDNFQIVDVDDTEGFSVLAVPGDGYDVVDGAIVPHSTRQGKLQVSVVPSDGDTTGTVFEFEV